MKLVHFPRIPIIPLFALLLAGFAAGSAKGAAEDAGEQKIWFEEATASPRVTDDTLRTLAAHVRHRMLLADRPGDAPILPRSLREDSFPRIVIISACDGVLPARIAIGTGRGLLKATEGAMALLRATEKDRFDPRWLKLDLPDTILKQENLNLLDPIDFERSLFGIALPRPHTIALLPEELVASDMVNAHQVIQQETFKSHLRARKPAGIEFPATLKWEDTTLLYFNLKSMFIDREEIFPLFRGHRSFTRLTREELRRSIAAAGGYLARSVDRYGQFHYLLRPTTNQVADGYDMSHHFAAVLALVDAYEVTKDPALLTAARSALAFTETAIGQWNRGGRKLPVVIEQGVVVKLGVNALATAAHARLAIVAGDAASANQARTFAETLIASQRADGSFIHFQRFPDGDASEVEHLDYTGQAIVGLMKVQNLRAEPRWTEAASKAAKQVILVRDKNLSPQELPHDLWLLLGLRDLHRHRPDALYLPHIARISRAMVQDQLRTPSFSDWRGGYHKPPASTPTAVRTEALAAAYTMLRDHGTADDRDDAIAALEAAIAGAAFQLTCQYRPENAMYFKDPQRLLGGFRESLTGPNIRIDSVQHNLAALLSLWRIMEEEKATSYVVPAAIKQEE